MLTQQGNFHPLFLFIIIQSLLHKRCNTWYGQMDRRQTWKNFKQLGCKIRMFIEGNYIQCMQLLSLSYTLRHLARDGHLIVLGGRSMCPLCKEILQMDLIRYSNECEIIFLCETKNPAQETNKFDPTFIPKIYFLHVIPVLLKSNTQ